jgi:hypothetical protein
VLKSVGCRMMKSEYSRLFKLLDGYAKRHHKCLLAEFSFDEDKGEYIVCFRPSNVSPTPDRYACRYFSITNSEAREILRASLLPVSVANSLDEELRPLSALQ